VPSESDFDLSLATSKTLAFPAKVTFSRYVS